MWSSCKAARGFCPDVGHHDPRVGLPTTRQKEGIVTETSAKRGSGRADKARGGNPVSRLFGAISLFVRQILDELRKVVRPTGPELVRYTTVVVVFVVIMMALVSGLDFVLSRLVSLVFNGSST
jgi:preprotein translocase subunit SecE